MCTLGQQNTEYVYYILCFDSYHYNYVAVTMGGS